MATKQIWWMRWVNSEGQHKEAKFKTDISRKEGGDRIHAAGGKVIARWSETVEDWPKRVP